MNATDEHLAYYLHTLAAHGGDYMKYHKSLGKLMNEAVENNHKTSWRLMDHTFRGGAAGNPYSVKEEDGKSFVKVVGAAYNHKHKPMAQALMEDKNRLLYFEFENSWDHSLWAKFDKEKPTGNDFKSVRVQAPQVMAKAAERRVREAERALEKAEAAVSGPDPHPEWPWVRAAQEEKMEKAKATLERHRRNEKCWVERCKNAGETGRLNVSSLADL